MSIDTRFLSRCIPTLEQALQRLRQTEPDSIEYDMYSSACIKEFEIILEQAGKLLRKCLKPWFHSPKAVDALVFKDLFRQAARHGLIDIEQAERWIIYRDNRNQTAHDDGACFAESTLQLLPQFIADAIAIEQVIRDCPYD